MELYTTCTRIIMMSSVCKHSENGGEIIPYIKIVVLENERSNPIRHVVSFVMSVGDMKPNKLMELSICLSKFLLIILLL